jgi:hypothetical protein
MCHPHRSASPRTPEAESVGQKKSAGCIATAPMRRVFVTLVLAAGVAIVAGTTTIPNFVPQTTAPLAGAIMEGVILGSTTWPSAPLDVQARLQLRPAGCDVAGRCASSED